MKKIKFKRCLICRKKAIWWDHPRILFFCNIHSKRFSEYLIGKIPKHSGWMKVRDQLGQQFLRLEKRKYKRNNLKR